MSESSHGQRQHPPPSEAPPSERFTPPSVGDQASESTTHSAEATAAAHARETTARESSLSLESPIVTAGVNGERNIMIEWIDVPMSNALSCRFIVKTIAGNALDVVMEQQTYRRTHEGTAIVTTSVVPVAPHGTLGRVIARDVATGEAVIQPWRWRWRNVRLGFFERLKRLFWKS